MSTFDYRPVWAGAYHDPAAAGGTVDRLSLYTSPDRDEPAVATAEPAGVLRPGVYRFTLPSVRPGRYWCTVTFTPHEVGQPVTDASVVLDLPTGQGLVASPEAVADALGAPLPLASVQRAAYEREIRNAQADVAAYLNRPLVPTATTVRGTYPRAQGPLDDVRAWPMTIDDIAEVVSYRATSDGAYDVDLLVGLHGAREEGVVRYVVAHAAEAVRQRTDQSGGPGRRVSSVSAEGQSVSYEAAPSAGQAGAPPSISSMSHLRRLVFQPLSRPPRAPWPYSPTRARTW